MARVFKRDSSVTGSSTCSLLEDSSLGRSGQVDPIAPGTGSGPPNLGHFQSLISWGSHKRTAFTCSREVWLYLLCLPSEPCVNPTVCSMGFHPAWHRCPATSSREPQQLLLQSRRTTALLCCSLWRAMKAGAIPDKIYFLASAQSCHLSLSHQWQCQTCAHHLTWLCLTCQINGEMSDSDTTLPGTSALAERLKLHLPTLPPQQFWKIRKDHLPFLRLAGHSSQAPLCAAGWCVPMSCMATGTVGVRSRTLPSRSYMRV